MKHSLDSLLLWLQRVGGDLIWLPLALLSAWVGYRLLRWFLLRLGEREPDSWFGKLHVIRGPFKLVLPALALQLLLPFQDLFADHHQGWARLLNIALICGVTWLAMRLVILAEELFLRRYPLASKDNLAARRVHTQVGLLRKIAILLLLLLGAGLVLTSFDKVRQLGTTLLASAGIAGIIIGFAAQKSIATLVAGVQMAFTQPIRIDDVVIVEGEWGRIEEITLTYVVVKIWDKRRLIVPVTFFLEKPFQNWTRVSADLVGAIHLHFDYSVPLAALREALKVALEGQAQWDGETALLQVVNSGPQTLECRVLVSAADASDAWDLRCHVREALITFVQENYPDSLPCFRVSGRALAAADVS